MDRFPIFQTILVLHPKWEIIPWFWKNRGFEAPPHQQNQVVIDIEKCTSDSLKSTQKSSKSQNNSSEDSDIPEVFGEDEACGKTSENYRFSNGSITPNKMMVTGLKHTNSLHVRRNQKAKEQYLKTNEAVCSDVSDFRRGSDNTINSRRVRFSSTVQTDQDEEEPKRRLTRTPEIQNVRKLL